MELIFKQVEKKEFEAVSELIMNMYNQHLKRYYSEKGDEKFRKTTSAKELEKRAKKGAHIYLVKEEHDLVGVFEFDKKSLAQFFIVDEFRGRGYGRMAINWLKKFYSDNNLGTDIVVQASPNAYLAFEKMGFEPVGSEKTDTTFVSKKMKLTV
ncbi:MAG: GNAT family N-acetyltransferase [Bacteroidia bacterium]